MSKIVLYGMDMSPPVRACLLTLNALNLPFEYKIVELFKGEHMTEEFLKHNPQHTVPVLDDNGTWIWDSHAINAYLVDKYGKDDILYPKDLAKRALINQRLIFDASILYMALRNITKPLYVNNLTVVSKEKTENVIEGYTHLENFLAEKPYLGGDNLTIADLCCVATVSSLQGLVPIDAEKYPKTLEWLKRLEKLPYYEKANGKAVKEYISFLLSKFTKIEI